MLHVSKYMIDLNTTSHVTCHDSTSITLSKNMDTKLLLLEDYIIIGLMLVISASIGLYFSVVKKKQSSTTEYFLASRSMGVIPMALSYFATTIATGTLLGFPVEIYNYGAQLFVAMFTVPIVIAVGNLLVIPIFHKMKSACIFKYFEIRFSRGLACAVAIASVIQMVCHSSVTLYGAAIALGQATALNLWLLSSIMAAICILYSTMGGIRGIIITDAVQALIMITSVVFLIVIGIIKSGGISNVWKLSWETDRLNLFNFDVDPRTRHTFWTAILGQGMLLLSTSTTSQSFVQRFLVAPTVAKAQCANRIGLGLMASQILVSGIMGLIIFAYFHGCNIMTTGLITNANQLVPYFAISIFSEYRCLSAICFGALVSASLSTISSALNSISAVIVETFIKTARPNMPDKKITIICKIIVLISGLITLLGISIVDRFPNIIQASLVVFSIFTAPFLMLYLIGICCPQANAKLATCSFVFSLLFIVWIAAGNLVLKVDNPSKPFLNDTCSSFNSNNQTFKDIVSLNRTTQAMLMTTDTPLYNTTNVTSTTSLWFYAFPLSTVSYQWYSFIGVATTIITFVLLTATFACSPYSRPLDDCNCICKEFIPDIIKRFHKKLNRKTRRIFLCDIYDE